MIDKIDHESAAFFAAIVCFWTLCSIATRWAPTLRVFWTQDAIPQGQATPWKQNLNRLLCLLFGVGYLAYFYRIHWTMPDIYRTLKWLAVFTAVASFGLLMAKFWTWSLAQMKSTKDQTH